MEKYKDIIVINATLFVVFVVLSSGFGLAGVGAIGVLQGCINLFIAGIVAFAGNKKKTVTGLLTLQWCIITYWLFFM